MNATSPATDPEPAVTYSTGGTAKSGGIKATWHLTIVTGKEAEALLEMQNQAIINLLTWVASHGKPAGQDTDGDRETRARESRGTLELAA